MDIVIVKEHEDACNLRFPATMNTKDDYCNCDELRAFAASKRVPFTNRHMPMKHRFQIRPHIALIDGYWRVSPQLKHCGGATKYWAAAHLYAQYMNGNMGHNS